MLPKNLMNRLLSSVVFHPRCRAQYYLDTSSGAAGIKIHAKTRAGNPSLRPGNGHSWLLSLYPD